MAHGHDAEAVPNYSIEKLRLFHLLAQRRLERSMAGEDLRVLRLVRCAVAGAARRDKGEIEEYNQMDAALLRTALGQMDGPPDQKAVISQIAKRLARLGAKVTHGRKH